MIARKSVKYARCKHIRQVLAHNTEISNRRASNSLEGQLSHHVVSA